MRIRRRPELDSGSKILSLNNKTTSKREDQSRSFRWVWCIHAVDVSSFIHCVLIRAEQPVEDNGVLLFCTHVATAVIAYIRDSVCILFLFCRV